MYKAIYLIVLLAFIFRLLLVPVAHHGDLNNNISWGNTAVSNGLNGFYEIEKWDYSAPNQPPLYILLFTLTSLTYKFFNNLIWYLNNTFPAFPSASVWFWQRWGMEYLVKLPSILADIGIAYLIFSYFKKKKNYKTATLLATVWLFNPVVWYNSSIWGQTDAIVNFLGLVSIIFLLKKKLCWSMVFFTLSLLFKGSLAIFVPILIIIAISQKHSFAIWIRSLLVSLGVSTVILIWFHPYLDIPLWFFKLYQQRILPGEIGDLTANAFNFWWLIDSGKTLDSKLLFGIQARIVGYGLVIAATMPILLKLKNKISDQRIFLSMAMTALFTFLFMTRIHERYLYPFFPVATIILGFIPTFLLPYIFVSLFHLLNLYYLFWIPPLPALEMLYGFPVFANTLAFSTILIFVYLYFNFLKKT